MSLKSAFAAIYNKTFLNSVFNAGRSLINPLFVALFSYLFISQNLHIDLLKINRVTALVNLALIFSGWGLRDYLFKNSVKHHADFNRTWHLAFYTKFILLIPILLISVFSLDDRTVIFIMLVSVFKTFNVLYEPLIVLHKRSVLFFFFDFLVALVSVVLIMQGVINTFHLFFNLLLVSEFLKMLLNCVIFRKPAFIINDFGALLFFLKDTKYYFFLVLVSFFQTKADLYVLGFLLNPGKLNEYQLLSSLISLVQIVIVGYIVSYSKLFYRNINSSELVFKRIVLGAGSLMALIASFLIYYVLNFIYGFYFSPVNIVIVMINTIAFANVLHEMFHYTRMDWLNTVLLFVIVAGAVNLLLSLLLVGGLGVQGALIANTGSLLALWGLMNRRRIFKQRKKILSGL
ncbi:MAG: hypothetical protein V4635_01015 [Bacteroidota bacterium]